MAEELGDKLHIQAEEANVELTKVAGAAKMVSDTRTYVELLLGDKLAALKGNIEEFFAAEADQAKFEEVLTFVAAACPSASVKDDFCACRQAQ